MYKIEIYFENGAVLKYTCNDYCEGKTKNDYPVLHILGIKNKSDDVICTNAVVFFDTVLGYTIEKLDPDYVPYEPFSSN